MKKDVESNRKFRSTWLLWALLLSILLFSQLQAKTNAAKVSAEEQHYISPRLQLGLHTKASMNSPIIELIASGAAVVVLKIEKEYSQIQTDKGSSGWIKSKFLTKDEPAELKVAQLEQALNTLQKEQEKVSKSSDNTAVQDQQIESACSEENSLDDTLSQSQRRNYEMKIADLQEEVKAWEQLDSQDKQAQQAQANKLNHHLQERLAAIAVLAAGKELALDSYELPPMPRVIPENAAAEKLLLGYIKKDYLLPIMIAGVSFFMGIFIMDLYNRRRHGGYRI